MHVLLIALHLLVSEELYSGIVVLSTLNLVGTLVDLIFGQP